LTTAFLAESPDKKPIEARLAKLLDYEKCEFPRKLGGFFYFDSRGEGGESQVLLRSVAADGSGAETVLEISDIEDLKEGVFRFRQPSPDDRYLAYSVNPGGSDHGQIRFRDTTSGKELSDRLGSTHGLCAWHPQGEGVFYIRFDDFVPGRELTKSLSGFRIAYHRLGASQSKDSVVFEVEKQDFPMESTGFSIEMALSGDECYLVIMVLNNNVSSAIYLLDIKESGTTPFPLVDSFDGNYWFVGSKDNMFFFVTDASASNRKVVGIDIDRPETGNWSTPIPESDAILTPPGMKGGVHLVGNCLVNGSQQDASSRLSLHSLDGLHTEEVELPGLGSIWAGPGLCVRYG